MTNTEGMEFVTWIDSKEHAFAVDIPKDWKVEGGMYRFCTSDTRCSFRLISPDNAMLLQIGDQTLPQMLLTPTPRTMQTFNMPIGVLFAPNNTFQNMILPYMRAAEFNRWYLNLALSQGVSNLVITLEQEQPEEARQQTETLNRTLGQAINGVCNSATTEFKGLNRATGQEITGIMLSTTAFFTMRCNPDMPYWSPDITVLGCNADADVEVHRKTLKAVLARIRQSFQMNMTWQQQQNQQMNGETNTISRQGQAVISQAGERSRQIAAEADANRQRIMGSYWNRVNAQNERQRHFTNYLSDQTDVMNTHTGQAYKVGSGYNHYYHDPHTGVILGTNSTDRPTTDFTPMEEF